MIKQITALSFFFDRTANVRGQGVTHLDKSIFSPLLAKGTPPGTCCAAIQLEQAVQKLQIDDSELKFLLHHFRECLSSSHAEPGYTLSDEDVMLLARAYRLWHEQGLDPEAIRSQLRQESSGAASGKRQAAILAFCSGRSGEGKSAILWNLAAALHEKGYRTTIVDGSMRENSFWKRLPATPQDHEWERTLEQGPRLIFALALGAADADGSAATLAEIENQSDFIFVDTGEGTADNALRFAMAVDENIVVTTPDVGANWTASPLFGR